MRENPMESQGFQLNGFLLSFCPEETLLREGDKSKKRGSSKLLIVQRINFFI